jgi:hypothetical protein
MQKNNNPCLTVKMGVYVVLPHGKDLANLGNGEVQRCWLTGEVAFEFPDGVHGKQNVAAVGATERRIFNIRYPTSDISGHILADT